VLAVRATAVRNEPVVLLIEPQRILDPTDPDIASHLSLPHGEILGVRNALCPSRWLTAEMLYESDLARSSGKWGFDLLDLYPIMILRDFWREYAPGSAALASHGAVTRRNANTSGNE